MHSSRSSSSATSPIEPQHGFRRRSQHSLDDPSGSRLLPKLASLRYPPSRPSSTTPEYSTSKFGDVNKSGGLGKDEEEVPLTRGHPLDDEDLDSQAEMGRRYSNNNGGPLDGFPTREPVWKALLKRRPVLLGLLALAGCILLWTQSSGSVSGSFSMKGSDQSGSQQDTPLKEGDALAFKDVQEQGQPKPANQECKPIPGKPDHQYALMIDAGSTGSRIHIYDFAFCQPPAGQKSDPKSDPLPTLKNEIFHQLRPGLSSFQGKPQAAAESLRPLMEEAMKAIPKKERSCTPVAVKATAGLRMLGKQDSQDILDEVKSWLESEWPFSVVKDDGVVIMDGSDEGVYAWVTINYLLGAIGPAAKPGASAAVMDLGGASTQIVFEPLFPKQQRIYPGDHVYDLSLPSGNHTLYQHSHLGYGLMQFRRSVHNLIAFTYVWQAAPQGRTVEWDKLTPQHEIPHPCMAKGGKKVVELDPPGRKGVSVTFVGTGAGYDACKRVVDVVMAKDALCEVEPCAFGGVYQPSLMDTFATGPIYALSYFYDRIIPLGLGSGSESFTVQELRELTQDVCHGPGSKPASKMKSDGWERFQGNREALDELDGRPEYCLDLTFMHSLLTLGYELDESREIRTGKQIDDVELGWTLGAAIAMLGGHLECSV